MGQLQYINDLEELGRKSSPNDEELSDLLQRYRACLNPMDFEDAIQCVRDVDFSVAGQVVVSSCVLYGKKVDKLRDTTQNLLQDIIASNRKRNDNAGNGDEPQLDSAPEPLNRKRPRRLREILIDEDFHDIENPIKTAQNIQQMENENCVSILECKLSHCAQVETNKKRFDVRLEKKDDKDKSRLRDWFLSDDLMVVRETFTEECMTDESRFPLINASFAEPAVEPRLVVLESADDLPVETESIIGAKSRVGCADDVGALSDVCSSDDEYEVPCRNSCREAITETVNHIVEYKLKPGKTTRLPCPKCNSRRPHAVCGKLCKQLETPAFPPLEAFFQSFSDKRVKRPLLGMIADKELTEPYIAHLNTLNKLKKQNDADFANAKGDASFHGFDDEDLDDDFDRCNNSLIGIGEDIAPANDADFDLPQANSALPSLQDDVHLPDVNSPLDESQRVDNTERVKELMVRITQWHESLRSKIAIAEERGTLDMDFLACRIMEDFPKDKQKISFRELVQNEPSTNVARYFLTCLQLANEGNLLIEPADQENSMFLEKLRDKRLKILNEYNPEEPKKKRKNVETTEARKRRHH